MIVGIIGAGTMGSGIAQAFAMTDGYEVRLCDIKEEFAENGKAKVLKNLNFLVSKEKITQEKADEISGKIKTGLKDICTDCDLVIEVCPERMDIKKATFEELQSIVKPECIFASNTSSLSITEMGNGLDRPLVGMHFFNPADRMKLIEVIADIDTAMKLGANHPMGPLALGDYVGLDIVLAIMEVIYNETGDSKYAPSPLLRKMVRAGKLGKKTGVGFYDYSK